MNISNYKRYYLGRGDGENNYSVSYSTLKQVMNDLNTRMTDLGFTRVDSNGSHDFVIGDDGKYPLDFALNEYWKWNTDDAHSIAITVISDNYNVGYQIGFSSEIEYKADQFTSSYSAGNIPSCVRTEYIGSLDYVRIYKQANSDRKIVNTQTNISSTFDLTFNNFETDNFRLFGFDALSGEAEFYLGLIKLNDEWRPVLITSDNQRMNILTNDGTLQYGIIKAFSDRIFSGLAEDAILLTPIYESTYNGATTHFNTPLTNMFECPPGILKEGSKYSINGELYYTFTPQMLVKLEG